MTINQQLADIRKAFIEKVNDFETAFKKFHTAECRNMRRRGMRDGNNDRPHPEADGLCSTEREIATAYAAQVSELAIDFGGFLEQVKKDHVETLKEELKKIQDKGITAEIQTLLDKKQQELSRAEEDYHEKINLLREDPNLKNLQQSLDEVDDELDELYEQIGRRHTNAFMKLHPLIYVLMLLFIGFAELAATYNAFLNFEEPPFTTVIWAVGVGVVIAMASHFIGQLFAVGREKKSYIVVGVLIALGVFAALYYVSKVRAESMADIPVKHISFEAFIAISFAVFLVGILLSFFTHDSNPTLSRLLKQYAELENEVQAKERSMYNQKQDLLKKMQATETAIHTKYNDEINKLENAAYAISCALNEAITLHDEILTGLKNIEQFIYNSFDRCMQEYRSANAEHRQSKEPEYWRKPVHLPVSFTQLPFLHDKPNTQGLWHYNPN